MKIYIVHDRLLDYYMTPIAAADDGAMKHSLSTIVNSPESNHAITQAPHHYDLYQVGEVTEKGELVSERKFLCTASDLIRFGGPETRRQARVRTDHAATRKPSPGGLEETMPAGDRASTAPHGSQTVSERPERDAGSLARERTQAGNGSEGR